jgi:hypothetical protein
MSLSAAERTELLGLATNRLPENFPAIHHLAAMYAYFGTHSALEVTEVIGEATDSGIVPGNFSGFIRGSNTSGFHAAVTDPNPSNPQTGHFFSYVMWALDGITYLEFDAALGHEFVSDIRFGHQADQVAAGLASRLWSEATGSLTFPDLVYSLTLDPEGQLDYAHLRAQFSQAGWTERIHEETHIDDSIPGIVRISDDTYYTGNSLGDLCNTVAGLHFGRMLRHGRFGAAANAVPWLERNVLDGPTRLTIAPGGIEVLRVP